MGAPHRNALSADTCLSTDQAHDTAPSRRPPSVAAPRARGAPENAESPLTHHPPCRALPERALAKCRARAGLV